MAYADAGSNPVIFASLAVTWVELETVTTQGGTASRDKGRAGERPAPIVQTKRTKYVASWKREQLQPAA